jgi:tetratricopeptide (TPR) repeat protein
MERAPGNAARAGELAEFVWMRRADLAGALAVLGKAGAAGASASELRLQEARLLEAAGESARAFETLSGAAAAAPFDPALALALAQAALRSGQLNAAEAALRRAAQLLPGRAIIQHEYATLQIAQGRPDLALQTALSGLQVERWNQSLWGLAATAARLMDDPIYPMLCDYEGMVAVHDIDAPAGWPTLEAFLADLGAALRALHGYRREPANQSVRFGSQTTHLLSGSPDPALRAAFAAFDGPIRAYMDRLGPGADPLRARNTGTYRIQGAWSVLLGRGGFHTDHLHPQGWISSAFYVEVPERVAATGSHEGWLRLGAAPLATPVPCPAERYVQPRPGRLVLFPSYMWHGVMPFDSDEERLTMAFDLIPA